MLSSIHQQESRKGGERESQAQHTRERMTMSDIKLPILVEPHPWENFESFMYRVVERNALRSVSEIFGALGVPYRKPLWANDHQQLSASLCGGTISLAQIFPTGLDSKTVAIGQQLLKRRHITLTPSRICPHCVAERGYGKLDWNLAPLVVCGEHRTYLIDQCPCTADSPLQSSRPGYASTTSRK